MLGQSRFDALELGRTSLLRGFISRCSLPHGMQAKAFKLGGEGMLIGIPRPLLFIEAASARAARGWP